MTVTTCPAFRSVSDPEMYVALELSAKTWKLAMTVGFGIVRDRARDPHGARRDRPKAALPQCCHDAGRFAGTDGNACGRCFDCN